MSIFAVVPVKSPLKSKTRLSIVLSPIERRTLTLTMLEDVLRAIKSSKVHQIVVISSGSHVQGLACKFGFTYLSESRDGLNQAIEQATQWSIQNRAESVLVLPADIPLLAPEDIDQMVKLGSEGTSVVVSSSPNGGTNALLKKPPNTIPACFGPHSFTKHVNKALARGISVRVYYSERVATDIDSLEDLRSFLKVKSQTISRGFLERINVNARLMNL